MKKLLFLLLISSSFISFSQKRLSRTINSSSDKDYAPSISANNKSLVYLRMYEMGPTYSLFQAKQVGNGVWSRPVEVEFYRKLTKLIYQPGFSLSADGNTMYFSCRKSPGIGRFDIWYSNYTNGNWSTPLNYAKPLNSASNDVCPTVSTDGKTMYFIKGTNEVGGVISGDIYTAQKRGKDSWTLPTKLQGNGVNTGNETKPVILADNETLVFSSNRAGGKGGYDLYISRLENGQWSSPKNMSFINTSGNDFDFAVPARGNIAYFNKQHQDISIDLFMSKIPTEFQPKKVTLLEGTFKNEASSTTGNVYVFDAETNKQIKKVKTDAKGNYFLTLTEGKIYDICFYPNDKTYSFYSELYDTQNQQKYNRIRKDIKLSKIKSGNSFVLNNVSFNQNSELNSFSKGELTRLARVLKANASSNITLKNYFSEYKEDTIQNAELTETRRDTLENEEVVTIYHNDKTLTELDLIKSFLIEKGIPSTRIKIEGITECDKSKIEVYFD